MMDKKKAEALKKGFRERLKAENPQKRVIPPQPPIYDEIFFEGVKYLDSLGKGPWR